MTNKITSLEKPEIFIGVVAPIGTNIDDTIDSICEKIPQYGYIAHSIRVTDSFPMLQEKLEFPLELKEKPLEDKYESYIKFGDTIRTHFDDDSILASITIDKIVLKRSEIFSSTDKHPEGIIYIIRQFKRREEIELLRSVYGRQFFQISVYSKRNKRVDNLARKIANSHNSAEHNRYREEAEHLVRTDEHEIEDRHGQRVSDIFHEADFIVNADTGRDKVGEQVKRLLDLAFGSNIISPTKMEYGLYIAKSASLRSLDLSRQVGAAVFSKSGEVISLGTNEVPKGGGGTYWCDEAHDDRDYKRRIDSNQKRKEEILAELLSIIKQDLPPNAREIAFNLEKNQFMDALEYGRVIHAEMSAIIDAARLGKPTEGAVLFCTTFPCHMCAKHIVAAGISEVVFLEPYPKSLASELHADSISIDGESRGDYDGFPSTVFRHFFGVSPRRYRDLFERKRRKDKDGRLQEWIGGNRRAVFDIKIPVYLQLEAYVLKTILSPTLSKAGISITDIHSDLQT